MHIEITCYKISTLAQPMPLIFMIQPILDAIRQKLEQFFLEELKPSSEIFSPLLST